MPEQPRTESIDWSERRDMIPPEVLEAKQAGWRAEGYDEIELDDLTGMFRYLFEMQEFEKYCISKGDEYWSKHPEEWRDATMRREVYEREKAEMRVKRKLMSLGLARRKEREERTEQERIEGLEGGDVKPKKGKPRSFMTTLGTTRETIDMLGAGGFEVGDQLKLKFGKHHPHFNDRNKLEIVGFDKMTNVMVQIDGDKVEVMSGNAAEEYLEVIK